MKGHSRGVVTIEYSPSQRIIVSAGFDHDILVWSPVAGQVNNVVNGFREGDGRPVQFGSTPFRWPFQRSVPLGNEGALTIQVDNQG